MDPRAGCGSGGYKHKSRPLEPSTGRESVTMDLARGRSGPCSPFAMTREAALNELLGSLFSAEELRAHHAHEREGGSEVFLQGAEVLTRLSHGEFTQRGEVSDQRHPRVGERTVAIE